MKKYILAVFMIFVFSLLMMAHITLDKTDNVLIYNDECYSVTEWYLQAGFLNAVARGSDPEECDNTPEGECTRTCSGGCSGCFQSTCHEQDDPYYCGAISPVGSDNIIYCWRPEP